MLVAAMRWCFRYGRSGSARATQMHRGSQHQIAKDFVARPAATYLQHEYMYNILGKVFVLLLSCSLALLLAFTHSLVFFFSLFLPSVLHPAVHFYSLLPLVLALHVTKRLAVVFQRRASARRCSTFRPTNQSASTWRSASRRSMAHIWPNWVDSRTACLIGIRAFVCFPLPSASILCPCRLSWRACCSRPAEMKSMALSPRTSSTQS